VVKIQSGWDAILDRRIEIHPDCGETKAVGTRRSISTVSLAGCSTGLCSNDIYTFTRTCTYTAIYVLYYARRWVLWLTVSICECFKRTYVSAYVYPRVCRWRPDTNLYTARIGFSRFRYSWGQKPKRLGRDRWGISVIPKRLGLNHSDRPEIRNACSISYWFHYCVTCVVAHIRINAYTLTCYRLHLSFLLTFVLIPVCVSKC